MSKNSDIEFCKRAGDRFAGKVYYDTKSNKFVQIRKYLLNLSEGMVCGVASYYRDATTTLTTKRLTVEYIASNLVSIDFSRTDLFKHDSIGWCVLDKEEKGLSALFED